MYRKSNVFDKGNYFILTVVSSTLFKTPQALWVRVGHELQRRQREEGIAKSAGMGAFRAANCRAFH